MQRQLTALLYRNAAVGLAVNLVTGALLAYVNAATHAPLALAIGWWACVAVVASGRFVLSLQFHAAPPEAQHASVWRRNYVVATALLALWVGWRGALSPRAAMAVRTITWLGIGNLPSCWPNARVAM